VAEEMQAHTEVAHGGEHAVARFLGLEAEQWVYLSVTIFFALVIWKKGHKMVTGVLDAHIQKVKDQLAEATKLRAEAENLKAEAVQKKADADKTALEIVANAKSDAETLVKDAAKQADTMIARRTKMAEDKIAAAERAAIDEVREKAASLAAAAARQILATRLDVSGHNSLVDQAIGELDRRLN
jgi:F-type H+-transporting ATPase subunit b